MLPVNFPGCNTDFGPPETMTDEECDTISGMKYVDERKVPFILFCLKPSYEDLKSFIRDEESGIGARFYLKIVSHLIAPFQMQCRDKPLLYTLDCMGVDVAGNPYACFKVSLSKDDIEHVKTTGGIFFNVFGHSLFPFCAFTLDENNEGNF